MMKVSVVCRHVGYLISPSLFVRDIDRGQRDAEGVRIADTVLLM